MRSNSSKVKERNRFKNMPDQVFDNVLEFLDVPSQYTLSSVSKSLVSLAKKKINEILEKRFKKLLSTRSQSLFSDLNEICSNLDTYENIAIAGSAIVQIILNKRYKGSDIDIYVTRKVANIVRRILAKNGFVLVHTGLESTPA